MKLNNFLLILFVANSILAQHKTSAKIEIVKKSGLHKIILPAEIRSSSKEELDDFRIVDSKGFEIPYFILQENNEATSSSFSEFQILSKTKIPKSKTTIVFENPKDSIEEIILSIANSAVTKSYSISGSDNQEEWFGLINNSQLYGLENTETNSVFKTISLPLSSYRYLKIEFDDKKTLPINILKIGLFTHKNSSQNLEEVFARNTKILQIPDQKKTRIYINFNRVQIINQINFTVTSPNLYRRNAIIFVNKKKTSNQKGAIFPETFSNFEFNSKTNNRFLIPQLFEKDFFIEIDNRDNQPLDIAKMQFFQNQITVIADLKTNEKYTIKTGNPKIQQPDYDLVNFKDHINSNLPEAKIYDIKHIAEKEKLPKDTSLWQQSWFMWLCIGLGGLVIAFFTINLVKDMKNNSSI